MHKTVSSALVALGVFVAAAAQAETIRAYGPGGPTPAMREAAAQFQAETGHEVIVTAGPAGRWMEQAREDADIIYSGSENMMSTFIEAHGSIAEGTIIPLYLRPSAILVRPGNPRGFTGLKSLMEPGVKVMVVQGAGQVGMWEDAVGRTGSVDSLRAFRDNIVIEAPNSGFARTYWIENPDVDAWLIWNHWQLDNPEIADMVEVEPELRIYRDTGVSLTERGVQNAAAVAFVDYLQSDAAAEIFAQHGWRREF